MADLYEQVAGTVRAFLVEGKAVSTETVTSYLREAIQLQVEEAEVEACLLALVAREGKEVVLSPLPHPLSFGQALLFGGCIFARIDDDYGFMVVSASYDGNVCYALYSLCRVEKITPKLSYLSIQDHAIMDYLRQAGYHLERWVPMPPEDAFKRLRVTKELIQQLIDRYYPQLVSEGVNGRMRFS